MTDTNEQIETPQTAVGNLAFALGWAWTLFSTEQAECFIESVVVLGKKAGLKREDFNCFGVVMYRAMVDAAWEKYSNA